MTQFLITVIPFVIFPQKADFLSFFSWGKHGNGQQSEQLIFIEITLFFIEVFRWKKKKFLSKNLIHPSIDDYLFLKNLEGNMTTAKKNVKNFILQGEHDKGGNMTKGGNMAKGITVFLERIFFRNSIHLIFFLNNIFLIKKIRYKFKDF